MKKILLIIALLISALGLNAQSVTIGYFGFRITSEAPAECEVSGYSGEPTDVTIPSTVTISGKEYTVTSIGNYAFYGHSSLTSIEVPSGVTSIGDSAFYYCSSLTSIEIPSGVTSIGDWGFFGCSSLTSIDFGENSQLTSIEECAFYGCSSLTSIEIPSGVTSIGINAFFGCSSLTSIDFGENSQLTSIGINAFWGCSSLTSIEIPSSVTSIGNCAFAECSGLTSVTFGENSQLTSIGYSAFYGCSSLTSIELPSGVTSIGEWAFKYCSSLTSIEIPSGVTSISEWAFQYCSSLTSIEIPSGVTSIGSSAFEGCSLLTSIYCYAETVPETSSSAFTSCNLKMVIYVPIQSVDAYETRVPWNNYTIMPLSYIVAAAANPEEAGVITGTGEYTLNDTVTLTATANEGYKFVNWTENDTVVSTEAEYSFVITRDRNLVANFELLTYEVVASVNIENAGEITGAGSYEENDTVTLTAKANEGYKFVNWTEDGEVISSVEEYSFVIIKDRNLVANFEKLEDPEEPADTTTLAAPTNLRAAIRQDIPGYNYKFEITMMWDAVDGAKGYDIYVNTADTIGFYMGYTNGTAYVAGTNNEGTLEFYVVAFNDSIESAPSETYTITIVDDAIEELTSSFNIYPNPVSDKLYIETLTQTQTLTVEIYDVYGRRQSMVNGQQSMVNGQQSMVNGQQSTVIDVTDLNSGVYFVKVVTSEGEAVKRFIKK